MNKILLKIIVIVCISALFSAPAVGAFTKVLNSGTQTGISLTETLNELYGLHNLNRVDDFDAAITDQYWTFANNSVTAEAIGIAKSSEFKHNFGFLPGENGSKFHSLFNSLNKTDNGVYKKPIGPKPINKKLSGEIFRLALDVKNKPGYRWSSAEADNLVMPNGIAGDGIDHMITFKITGNDGFAENKVGNYIVAWEDQRAKSQWSIFSKDYKNLMPWVSHKPWENFDGDYNDLIVEISGVQPLGSSIPVAEPVSVLLFGLSGLVLLGRPRRRKIT